MELRTSESPLGAIRHRIAKPASLSFGLWTHEEDTGTTTKVLPFHVRILPHCVLAASSAIPLLGLLFLLPSVAPLSSAVGVVHWVMAVWTTVQFVYNFCMAAFHQPGWVTQRHQPSADQTFVIGPYRYAPRQCDVCGLLKPPRARHCSALGRCVLRMDHWCPWIGNAVGLCNHGHFVLIFVFGLLGCLHVILLVALHTAFAAHDIEAAAHSSIARWALRYTGGGITSTMMALHLHVLAWLGWESALLLAGAFLALLVISAVGGQQLYHVWTGQTVIEATGFGSPEFVEVKPNVWSPLPHRFYDRGPAENIRSILGDLPVMRLLLPISGRFPPGAGVHFVPLPSRLASLGRRMSYTVRGTQKQPAHDNHGHSVLPSPERPTSPDFLGSDTTASPSCHSTTPNPGTSPAFSPLPQAEMIAGGDEGMGRGG
ncbi:unnamed protein product [Vitrella brassicaformis CCMP3155]|uniref:Palmitoyltransferase n=1 Tax=Vitrella brassicaformis (strain CCMP3155) TaxID=1169540 RepID=A0A0G4EBR0_VITBC|nr:unnamed protein product [Vitrella brassicaformis CCMP3155]|eukprot:CEL92733.1 unnamed protein product [Vitrella brassicaformis CCMP3155]